jgi:hypothetical protein
MGLLDPPFDLLLDGRDVDIVLGAASTAVDLDLSMEKSLHLSITVADQQRKLFAAGILDTDHNGRLDKRLDIRVGEAWYRLASADKQGDAFTLACEDRSAAILRAARGPLKPRDGEDHVRFVKHLCALSGVPFATPTGVAVAEALTARKHKEARAAADQRREKGIAEGADLKIKGETAKAEQIRNIEITCGVAAKEKAGMLAQVAMHCAAIGESNYTNAPPNRGGYRDVFQGTFSGVALQAHYFLRGGRGFNQGGAIALAKAHPGMSPGEIATRVETSGEPAEFYGKYEAEARAIIAHYAGADRSGQASRTTAAVLVQRGTPQSPQESSLTAITRIGAAKGYRAFFDRNTLIYADEHDLIDSRVLAILSEDSQGVDWIDGQNDPGQKTNTASLQVLAKLWSVPQGSAIIVRETGFLNGRWLVSSVKQARFSVVASIELRRGSELLQPEATAEVASSTGPIVIGGTQSGGIDSTDLYAICEHISSQHRGYLYGGGHAGTLAGIAPNAPLDCSSSTSLALKRAGMFTPTTAWVSGQFASSWGQAGRGEEFTVWANDGHVWIQFHGAHAGWNFNTAGHDGDRGPRLVRNNYSSSGFTARHWSNR